MTIERVVINVDGASRGNPGASAIGATIRDGQGRLIACLSQPIGQATNNQAEYRAVIAALGKALDLGARNVEVRSDSELMVKQIKGIYRVRNAALKPLYQQVKQLQGSLEGFTITHIPREQNADADSLCNKALDAK